MAEVDYKKEALQDSFMNMAEEILKAKLAVDGTVHIDFNFDNQPFEIFSLAKNPGQLIVRHRYKETELEGADLQKLKVVLLKQYMRLKRDAEGEAGQIDLTAFDLTGFDLSEMDFRNCALPDLVRCNLSGMSFDSTTTFNKRLMCVIDDETFDRLQDHALIQKKLLLQKSPIGYIEKIVLECPDEPQSIGRYTLGQVFGSDNPDLGSIKRFLLQDRLELVKKTFEQMRQEGIPIYLAHVDLRGLRLAKLDLQKVNMYGADLTDTDLDNAQLMSADLRCATFVRTSMRNADLWCAKMHRAKIISMLVYTADQSNVVSGILGGEYGKGTSFSYRRLSEHQMMLRAHGN
jgi:uncharacterized protein YjbI with pentapeptide repeats